MDVRTIEAFHRVIEDLQHDTELDETLKTAILSALTNRALELENWETN